MVWLSAYDKATVVSKSYANTHPDANSEFIVEIKTAIESVGGCFQQNDILCDDDRSILQEVLNFHPGCRPSLLFFKDSLWIKGANEPIAYGVISKIIQRKREGVEKPKRNTEYWSKSFPLESTTKKPTVGDSSITNHSKSNKKVISLRKQLDMGKNDKNVLNSREAQNDGYDGYPLCPSGALTHPSTSEISDDTYFPTSPQISPRLNAEDGM